MDDRDLALVARLCPEPTPDDDVVTRQRHQLQTAIRAAANGSADGDPPTATDPPTTDAAPTSSTATAADTESPSTDQPDPHVVRLTRRRAGRGGRRSWRRGVVAAAAAVVVLGGVLAAVGLPSDDDRTVTGTEGAQPQPGPPEEAPCGTELPFTFPAPPGYEGPLPGPSENITPDTERAVPADAAQDMLQVHWRSAEGTIDVRWPSYPSVDPTTLWDLEATSLGEDYRPQDEGWVRGLRVATTAIGAGHCQEIGIVATSDDPAVMESTLDQIGLALAGPGGILPSPATGALVSESIEAEALPEIRPDCESESRTTDDMGTYPTPTEALAAFLVTEPGLMQWRYQEVALPDGSFGYVNYTLGISQAGDPTVDPRRPPTTDDVVAVVHVVPRGDGWSAESWQSCSP